MVGGRALSYQKLTLSVAFKPDPMTFIFQLDPGIIKTLHSQKINITKCSEVLFFKRRHTKQTDMTDNTILPY